MSAAGQTARDAGLVACTRCGLVSDPGVTVCPRCGSPVTSRRPGGLQVLCAWLLAGLICYIPANLEPMLITSTILYKGESTIVGGVIELIHYESYAVAAVIFFASVMIPIGKFLAVGVLALSVQRGWPMSQHKRLVLFEVVEFIGRWSMIDVFVVAILAALVQLDIVVTILPGPAAVNFALTVIFTMIAAQQFDPRLIWDGVEGEREKPA